VPAAQDDMALAHLYCVGVAGGRPRAGLCGATRAPAWTFNATTVRSTGDVPYVPSPGDRALMAPDPG